MMSGDASGGVGGSGSVSEYLINFVPDRHYAGNFNLVCTGEPGGGQRFH